MSICGNRAWIWPLLFFPNFSLAQLGSLYKSFIISDLYRKKFPEIYLDIPSEFFLDSFASLDGGARPPFYSPLRMLTRKLGGNFRCGG